MAFSPCRVPPGSCARPRCDEGRAPWRGHRQDRIMGSVGWHVCSRSGRDHSRVVGSLFPYLFASIQQKTLQAFAAQKPPCSFSSSRVCPRDPRRDPVFAGAHRRAAGLTIGIRAGYSPGCLCRATGRCLARPLIAVRHDRHCHPLAAAGVAAVTSRMSSASSGRWDQRTIPC